jgi:glucose-6-phosphate isomerase
MRERERFSASLGDLQPLVDSALTWVMEKRVAERIWAYDHTVWKDDPREIRNRLGWLKSPAVMSNSLSEITSFVDDLRKEGFTDALLLGMGGSSLGPEMFRQTFGVKEGYLDLSVLDSTDPGAVLEHSRRLDPRRTLYIVSTKSGGTIETLSFMKFFYNHALNTLGPDEVGRHFVAITDPGSGLESAAVDLKFRKVFLNDPDIGGRYSVLSYFGLVPAALIGMNLDLLLERAKRMASECKERSLSDGYDSSVWLGVILGELARAGRDKVTLILSPPISHFGIWAEQLIAESTGKEGKGIVPVDGEMIASPEIYANDRLFVYIRLEGDETFDGDVRSLNDAGHPLIQLNMGDIYDLGAECFRWEMATAVAGVFLGINPFDQPDVESAKIQASKVVETYGKEGRLPELLPTFQSDDIRVYTDLHADSLEEIFEKFFAQAEPGSNGRDGRSYTALQAYVRPDEETYAALQDLRRRIQVRYKIATTLGYGPRFLHSTGQLHKGGPDNGLFIQLIADIDEDIPIPERAGSDLSSISFGVLRDAQAIGDRNALVAEGRKVLTFRIGSYAVGSLKRLIKAVR